MPYSGSSTSPLPVMISEVLAVGHGEHRLEAAQDAVGAPVLGQLDGGARQVALVLLELGLEALEQREGIGRRAGEAGQHLVVVEPAHLARRRLDDDVAERDLAVAAERDDVAAAHADDRRAVIAVPSRADCGAAAADSSRRPARSDGSDLDRGVLVDAHRAEEERDHAVGVDEIDGAVLGCAAPAPS